MRHKIASTLAFLTVLAMLLVAGCMPGESPTPTVPADTPQPARPSWLRIYTDVTFKGPGLGLICGWHGTILRSVDTGQTWSDVQVPSTADLNSVAILDNNVAVAVGSSGNILRSSDGGQNWYKVQSPTTEVLNAVAAAGDGRAVAVGWRGTIIVTFDGGLTWKQRDSGDPSLNFEAVAMTPGGVGMAASANGSVLKTTDLLSWQPMTLPSADQKLYALDVFDENNVLVAGNIDLDKSYAFGGKTIILKTEDGGQIWGYGPRTLNFNLLAMKFVDRRNALAAGWDGVILRTDDGGATWITVVSKTNQALRAMATADATTIVAVGDGQTIITSRNGGYTWEKLRGS